MPILKLVVTADIKPLPDYVSRIENATVGQGEELGGFNIWPATQPRVTLERAERLTMSLRIRRSSSVAGTIPFQEGSTDGVAYKVRQDGGTYWLDLTIDPSSEPGRRGVPIALKVNDGQVPELGLSVRINVLAEGLVITPRSLDLGEVSLSAPLDAVGRVGIRRTVGNIRVAKASSTLAFLRFETQTIVDGSNYVIRVTLASSSTLAPGTLTGTIVVETDDKATPRIEVPVRITFLK
jgi:hypothetical protein